MHRCSVLKLNEIAYVTHAKCVATTYLNCCANLPNGAHFILRTEMSYNPETMV